MTLAERSLTEFAHDLAGDAPAPGGGSAAAYAGAMAAALAAMVARLTLAKAGDSQARARLEAVVAAADPLVARFLALLEADSAAYNQVAAAFKLPKADPTQQADRSRAIQCSLRHAAEVPLDTLAAAAGLARLLGTVVADGNPNCISDAGSAVYLCRAGAQAAACNVRINLAAIRDGAFVETCGRSAERLLEGVEGALAPLEKAVAAKLAG
ncbi:MAG TPA: cyclodeaminase/cyclohydrolase family protein [Desulfobacterales bacterium]|nr:cyclodeaminase/cyclohydrolase family protein [Desulfobacterales bacterium]